MSRDMRFKQCGLCDQQSLRSACAYAQSDQSLCQSFDYSTTVKLLTECHLELLSLKVGCTDTSEFTHVKMPHCWKSHVTAHSILSTISQLFNNWYKLECARVSFQPEEKLNYWLLVLNKDWSDILIWVFVTAWMCRPVWSLLYAYANLYLWWIPAQLL